MHRCCHLHGRLSVKRDAVEREIGILQKEKKGTEIITRKSRSWGLAPIENRLQSSSSLGVPQLVYMGRRLSMLSMFESVELRLGPLSLTRSVMRMLGRLVEACVVGGGEVPSLRAGGGWRGLDGGVG
jgi:hypothetical protein